MKIVDNVAKKAMTIFTKLVELKKEDGNEGQIYLEYNNIKLLDTELAMAQNEDFQHIKSLPNDREEVVSHFGSYFQIVLNSYTFESYVGVSHLIQSSA